MEVFRDCCGGVLNVLVWAGAACVLQYTNEDQNRAKLLSTVGQLPPKLGMDQEATPCKGMAQATRSNCG